MPIKKKGRSLKLRIAVNSVARELGLGKLVAEIFLPNPHSHQRILFKDGNCHNCHADNIQWVSQQEYVRQGLFPGKPLELPLKPKRMAVPKEPAKKKEKLAVAPVIVEELPADAKPVPGYEGCHATANGVIYQHGTKRNRLQYLGRGSCRVRLYNKEGKAFRVAVAKLVALCFVPNPHGFTKLILKDHDPQNCVAENILWVNSVDWCRHVKYLAESAELLGMPLPVKEKPVVVIDADAVPVENFPGYLINPAGKVWKDGKPVRWKLHRNRAPIISLYCNRHRYFFGLATLVAEHFVQNPRCYKRVIFKDRNNRNCTASNLAWVDEQTFAYYCTGLKGGKKKRNERDDAIARCTDPWLRNYYSTGDMYWLHECWKRIEESIFLHDWNELKSEAYLYFIDRAERFTILYSPAGFILNYAKWLRKKLKNEISPELPIGALLRTDESMRDRKKHCHYDYEG